MKRALILLIAILLTACAPAWPAALPTATLTPFNPAPQATPILVSPTPFILDSPTPELPTSIPSFTPLPPTLPADTPLPSTETPSLTPIYTPTEYPSSACGWNWASEPLPELSAEFLAKLQAAGLPVEAARAQAYGENCFASDGSIVRFAAMQTDYYITITVADLTDESNLGSLLDMVLSVVDFFPVGQTPGPQPGYIGLAFKAGDQIQNLWLQRTRVNELRAQGLQGADLYRALKNP